MTAGLSGLVVVTEIEIFLEYVPKTATHSALNARGSADAHGVSNCGQERYTHMHGHCFIRLDHHCIQLRAIFVISYPAMQNRTEK